MGYGLRFIDSTLYELKREYGVSLNIVWITAETVDTEAGKMTITRDSVSVNRAIVLPSTTEREFAYDLTFIASNKNFTYGGLFDTHRRRVIIDRRDLPTDFEIKVGYWLVFQGKRYEVEEFNEFSGRGFYIVAKQATDVELENFIQRHIFSLITLEQTVEYTL